MYLIIGANGFIGNHVYQALKADGRTVKGSFLPAPRNLAAADAVYLDLERPDFTPIQSLQGIECVILCHGISSLDQCRMHPERTRLINVENTCRLLECFDPSQTRIVFLSSSLVYKGDRDAPSEQEKPQPITEYGRQKADVEAFILRRFSRALVLRLTKIFGLTPGDQTLFTQWADRLRAGQKINVATDSSISPVYVNDLVIQLRALLYSQFTGVFNLGGQQSATLAAWGHQLAGRLGFEDQVDEIEINALGLVECRARFNSVDSSKLWQAIGKILTPMDTCFELLKTNYGIKGAQP